jgi:hypothetical protein
MHLWLVDGWYFIRTYSTVHVRSRYELLESWNLVCPRADCAMLVILGGGTNPLCTGAGQPGTPNGRLKTLPTAKARRFIVLSRRTVGPG